MTPHLYTNCLKVSLFTFCLLIMQAGTAQRNVKEYSTPSFTDLNTVINQQAKAIGKEVVVLVWTDTLVYRKETADDFSARTPAAIGDASSWLTAATVMALVADGKLSLDDKVSTYLPEFKKYGKSYITLRHCLTHQTGIKADQSKLTRLFDKKKFTTLEERVSDDVAKEIQTNPGTEMWYSPIGMTLAGRVLEVVMKKKFELIVQQRLLRPLGMRNTSFSTMDGSAPDPAAGARSTADDYLKFLVMLLNKGQYKGQAVLTEAAVNELLQLQQPVDKIKYAPKDAPQMPYAMGSWIIESKATGEPVTYSSMSFGGTFPILDICRHYAAVFIAKDQTEVATNTYLQLIKHIEDRLPAGQRKCE